MEDKEFPNWETLYEKEQIHGLPWYYEDLDLDLNMELDKRHINNGSILDLGTGPGTQAIKLYEKGFQVSASDISKTAIKKANELYNKDIRKINFIVDDIIKSNFEENEFDYIFDRGCFHVLSVSGRNKYVGEIKRILNRNGVLFLKCFSIKEPGDYGPYRFSQDDLKNIFQDFEILTIKETVYQGTLNPLPKALFVVAVKK
ncbi:MAG TPA: class I SAM-dependent methyltransferase [Candidatus Nitrosocosmicus sp.]